MSRSTLTVRHDDRRTARTPPPESAETPTANAASGGHSRQRVRVLMAVADWEEHHEIPPLQVDT